MKVIEFFEIHNNKHYMPIIWLSLGDQLIIISNYSIRYQILYSYFLFSCNIYSQYICL